jgi:hypothetical protein
LPDAATRYGTQGEGNGRAHVCALLLYIAVVAVVYAPVLFGGKSLVAPLLVPHGTVAEGVYARHGRTPVNSFNVDIATPAFYEAPVNRLVGDTYLSGHLPLWNPYQASGTPLAAQYSTRAFFPYQILEDISPAVTWDFFMLARLVVAGFFSYLFLQMVGLSFVRMTGNGLSFGTAFLGGLFYMLSGVFGWFINLEQLVNNAMMLPVLMCAVESVLLSFGRGGQPVTGFPRGAGLRRATVSKSTVYCALSVGLLLSAGQPEVALYISALAALYLLFRLFCFRGVTGRLFTIVRFSFAYLLGLAMAAPLIVPFIELVYSSHHIHPAGGSIGIQSMVNWRSVIGYLTPSATIFPADPEAIVGASNLVRVAGEYHRFGPINGVWDTLGGYTGGGVLLLLAVGTVFALIDRSPFRRVLLFFVATGAIILLKNLGVEPFVSIGRLPLFDRVWSLRWAGPVLIFSVSMAAAFSFEVLSNTFAKMVTKVTDGRVADGVLCLRTGARPVVVLLSICTLAVLSYVVLALFPVIELVVGADRFFNALMAPFVTPSLLYSTLFTLLVLLLCSLLFLFKARDAGNRYSLAAAVAALTILELWWAVPRGWGADWLVVKWIPAALGMIAVVLFFVRYFKSAAVLTLLFTALFLYFDSASTRGLPERQDPFVPAPYVEFIKKNAPYARTLGAYGTLFPNFASALKLYDVHYVNSLVSSEYHDFKDYLYAERFKEGPNSELWFTGRPERSVEREAATGPGAIYNKVSRPVENDIAFRLKSYSLLGVKYFVLPSDESLTKGGFSRFVNEEGGPLFPLVYDKEVRIHENPYALDRAYVVHSTVVAGGYEEAQKIVASRSFDIRETAVVEAELDFLPAVAESAFAAARITEYGMNFVKVEAETEVPGLLVLSDTYYPGWRVTVNGIDTEVLRVNGLVRGVAIGSGSSTVLFRYCPLSFSVGLLLFALSVLLCTLLYIAARKREN